MAYEGKFRIVCDKCGTEIEEDWTRLPGTMQSYSPNEFITAVRVIVRRAAELGWLSQWNMETRVNDWFCPACKVV